MSRAPLNIALGLINEAFARTGASETQDGQECYDSAYCSIRYSRYRLGFCDLRCVDTYVLFRKPELRGLCPRRVQVPVGSGARFLSIPTDQVARAAFTYKNKLELEQMSQPDLDAYIEVLRLRTSWLRGPALKSTEKHIAVAVKIRESLHGADESNEA